MNKFDRFILTFVWVFSFIQMVRISDLSDRIKALEDKQHIIKNKSLNKSDYV